MNPVPPTQAEFEAWGQRDGYAPTFVVIGGPEEGPDVIPCPALAGFSGELVPGARVPVVHVAYKLDEIELAHLAQGGTLWLTTFGQLPIHQLEVSPPPDRHPLDGAPR